MEKTTKEAIELYNEVNELELKIALTRNELNKKIRELTDEQFTDYAELTQKLDR